LHKYLTRCAKIDLAAESKSFPLRYPSLAMRNPAGAASHPLAIAGPIRHFIPQSGRM